jgi:hypothetical protein
MNIKPECAARQSFYANAHRTTKHAPFRAPAALAEPAVLGVVDASSFYHYIYPTYSILF